MIKAVFFDFDGVLTLEGNGADAISLALAQQTGIAYESFLSIYKKHASKLDLAPKHYETILKPLNDELGTSLIVNDILRAARTTKLNQAMFKLVDEVRANKLITEIITDNNIDRIDVLRKPFNLDKFDSLIVSANIGSGKWQSDKIFKAALDKAGVKPNESIFIDNTENNLAIPRQLGMYTYWHDHRVNNISALRQRLVELGALKPQ